MPIRRVVTYGSGENIAEANARLRGESPLKESGVTGLAPPLAKTAGPATFALPVGKRTAWVDPATLDEHPLARRYFDLGEDAENAELLESVRGRMYSRLLVTGDRCASGPGVTLDGRRRRQAALRAGVQVEVEYLDDLDDGAELQLLVHSNIAASLSRRLTERRKAELEQALRHAYGSRQGERTDLSAPVANAAPADTTSAASGGSEGGETRDLIAEHMRESRHAVDDREAIYFRAVSPESLKRAVDNGDIKRSPAAALVHGVEREPEVAAVLEDARRNKTPDDILAGHPVIVAAKRRVIAALNERLHKEPPKPPKPKPIVEREASAPVIEGFASIPNFLGHKVVVQIDAGKVVMVDRGAADPEPTAYDPRAPTTRQTWAPDVRATVDDLPTELREQVAVGEVEALDPPHCPTCGGSRFYRAGGCVRCSPMTTIWQIRQRIEDAERPAIEALYTQLARTATALRRARGSAGHPDKRRLADLEEKEILDEARTAMYAQIDQAVSARQSEIDAEFRAAAEVDRRLLVTHGDSVHDLRYPRQRIIISTPFGELHVVLWERVEDTCGPGCEGAGRAGIRVGDRGTPIVLDARGEGAWNHWRAAMRGAVHRAIMDLFDAARRDRQRRDLQALREDLLGVLSRRAEQRVPEPAPNTCEKAVEMQPCALVFEPPAAERQEVGVGNEEAQGEDAALWQQVRRILAAETRDLKNQFWGLDEGAEWRHRLIAELRVVVDESRVMAAARPIRLAASTLRRRLRRAGIDVPPDGPIDLRWWRDLAAHLRRNQYAEFVRTIPLLLAYHAAIGHRAVSHRSLAGYRREVQEAIVVAVDVSEPARQHLHVGVADVLIHHHARLGRMRRRAAESASFWASMTVPKKIDIEGACGVLGIAVPGAGELVDESLLAASYRRRAVACHPDRHGGDAERGEELRRLNVARDHVRQYNDEVRA